jgi:hypothetical protein
VFSFTRVVYGEPAVDKDVEEKVESVRKWLEAVDKCIGEARNPYIVYKKHEYGVSSLGHPYR